MLDKDVVDKEIKTCNNFTELAKKLNRTGAVNIKRFVDNNKIDYSHFYTSLSNSKSHQCSAQFNKNRKNTGTVFNTCLHCKSLIQKRYNIFCDNNCRKGFLALKRKTKIESGNCSESHLLKEYIKQTNNDNCAICGQLPTHNNLPLTLQLDHIDGNSDNNKLENLRLLCPNCHTQTPTFKSRNFKNTKRLKYARFYRRKIQQQL
jgi:hypothetical protein